MRLVCDQARVDLINSCGRIRQCTCWRNWVICAAFRKGRGTNTSRFYVVLKWPAGFAIYRKVLWSGMEPTPTVQRDT
ncbi:hypothetical protein KCP74_15370 [Salmonella enterica subsp. enterica]|nr:hypothetical protein KCP74_15370 [Salmonella enterica subsp. enterica]